MAGVSSTALDALAERVQQGEALGDQDVALILESHDLVAIGMVSDELRRQMHGTDTTFVRVLEAHVDAPPAALPPGVKAGESRICRVPASLEAPAMRGGNARASRHSPWSVHLPKSKPDGNGKTIRG